MTRFQRAMARSGRKARLGAVALFVTVVPAASQTLTVNVDAATLAAVPERVATIIVGNPLIADVSLQPGRLLVVTGKSYGSTNLLALDSAGAVLMERNIQVKEARDATLHLFRGVVRETYSCTPNCERRITLGDTPSYFNETLGQSASRNNMAGSAGGSQR